MSKCRRDLLECPWLLSLVSDPGAGRCYAAAPPILIGETWQLSGASAVVVA